MNNYIICFFTKNIVLTLIQCKIKGLLNFSVSDVEILAAKAQTVSSDPFDSEAKDFEL